MIKALLLLFVFCAVLAVVYCGSVNVKDCDKGCSWGGLEEVTNCCKKNGYKDGHCSGIPIISLKAWCD